MQNRFNPGIYNQIKDIISSPNKPEKTCFLQVQHWEYRSDGECITYSIQNSNLNDKELIEHIKKAKTLHDADITASETEIIVKRMSKDGKKGITAIYLPLEGIKNVS